jgi:hypothetical protein
LHKLDGLIPSSICLSLVKNDPYATSTPRIIGDCLLKAAAVSTTGTAVYRYWPGPCISALHLHVPPPSVELDQSPFDELLHVLLVGIHRCTCSSYFPDSRDSVAWLHTTFHLGHG